MQVGSQSVASYPELSHFSPSPTLSHFVPFRLFLPFSLSLSTSHPLFSPHLFPIIKTLSLSLLSRSFSWPCAATCRDGEISLINGNYPSEGTIQICLNNVWGTVCDDLWDRNDATVVCNSLGYRNGQQISVAIE